MTLALAFVGAVVMAGTPDEVVLSVTTGSTSNGTDSATVRGWIEEVSLDVVTAGTTGNVSVVAVPGVSTLANVTLASDTNLTADKVFRPRFDGTDTSGNALTTDPPGRYMHLGSVRLNVTNASATGVVFKAAVKLEKK